MDGNMKYKYKVSVIVPIYNIEKYLEDCLNSLERQTLGNIEVILVCDGPTDSSERIAERYVEKNKHFSLISQSNKGIGGARNAGIKAASGEYFYFLDGDDYIEDNALEVLYERAHKANLDVLFFSSKTFKDGIDEFKWPSHYAYKKDYDLCNSGEELVRKIIGNRDLYNPNCGMMFIKSTLFANKNLHFKSRIIYEDNLFYPNLMHMAGKCAVMNEPLHYRRFSNNSVTLSSDNTDKKLTSNYIVVHKIRKMISDFGRTPTVLLPLSRTCYQFSNIYWMQNRQVRKKHRREYLSVVSVILSERLFGRRFFHHLKKVFLTRTKAKM